MCQSLRPTRHLLLLLLIAIIGIASTLWGIHLQQKIQINAERAIFERQSADLSKKYQQTLGQKIEVLQSLQAFYLSSESISRQQFHRFVNGALSRHPDIIALNWIPLVAHARRSQFEASLQPVIPESIGIYQTDLSANRRQPSPTASVYLPVEFSEPFQNNLQVFGLNVLSRPLLAETIRQVYRHREILSAPPIKLVQHPNGPPGIIVFAPIFNSNIAGNQLDFPVGLDGLLALVLHPGLTLQNSIDRNSDRKKINYRLRTKHADGMIQLSFDNTESSALTDDDFLYKAQIDIPGSHWLLETYQHPNNQFRFDSYLTLILGLLITGLLIIMLTRDNKRALKQLSIAQQLAKTRQQAQAAVEIAQIGICEFDFDSGDGTLNDQAALLLRKADSDSPFKLDQLLSMMSPACQQQFAQQVSLLRNQKQDHFEIEAELYQSAAPAASRWFQFLCKSHREPDSKTVIVTFIDISQQKQAEARLTQQANHDALTGLPNRRLLNDRLQIAISNAHRHKTQVAIALLDLNKFKPINDELGHDSGDLLLIQLAQRLTALTRGSDTCARIGGDEFLLVLSEQNNTEQTLLSLQRVHQELQKPFELYGHTVTISASIGVASYPADGESLTQLMRRADQAMYAAKKLNGGETISYSQINL